MRARRNIELKARAREAAALRQVCAEIGAESAGVLVQRDTYFEVPRGRLKLREQQEEQAQLIAYERADEASARESRFSIVTVTEPGSLLAMLTHTLGVRARVAKRRELYLWQGVRIHLDRVEGLGDFIEFEAPVEEGAGRAAAASLVHELRESFEVTAGDLVSTSYCDLMLVR